jgi:phosphinothricin acetyltransferase
MQPVEIRSALPGDLPGLTEIYNHYVRETPITFDVRPHRAEERRAWLEGFAGEGRHRLFVAERAQRVVGYACSQRFRSKAAYDTSVETTVYLDPAATGAGIGGRLYTALFDALAREDVHRALAGITLPNPASIALHKSFGFTPVGVFREVGYKLGRHWDVQWFERAMR